MTRKANKEEGRQLFRKSQILTDFVLHLTDNQADYIILLLLVLGNGVAAFSQDESDIEFEKKLAKAKQVLDNISRDARQRLMAEALEEMAEETKH
jgi:hypothetical protein